MKIIRALSKFWLLTVLCILLSISIACSDRSKRFELLDVQNEITDIAKSYIIAEYQGDQGTLIAITKDEALRAVKNGELEIFKSQKLNKIDSLYFERQNKPDTMKVVVTVVSQTFSSDTPSNYYEHIQLKKINNKWYIVKVERDT